MTTIEEDLNIEKLLAHAGEAERFLKQMANKTRLMVLCSLLDDEFSVSDLLTRIPVTQPVLSQHLALLREAEMVNTRRDGQTIFYSLADERVKESIAMLYRFFCE